MYEKINANRVTKSANFIIQHKHDKGCLQLYRSICLKDNTSFHKWYLFNFTEQKTTLDVIHTVGNEHDEGGINVFKM